MIVMHQQDIKKDGKVVATLRIYLEGTGNPKDDHNIKAFSIDKNGFGNIPALNEIDKIENLSELKI